MDGSANNARSRRHRLFVETETATGLIYYWRKTEIKCSATACETYGAHVLPTTFVLPFVFNGFQFFYFSFFSLRQTTTLSPSATVSFLVFPASPFSLCLFSHARHRLRNLSSASANCPQRRSCRGPSKQVVLLVLLSPRTPNARGIRCSRVYKYLRQRKCNFGESRRRKYNMPESSKAFARV